MTETIWIIGAGHFGQHALKTLSKTRKTRRFVLIDPVKEHLEQARNYIETRQQFTCSGDIEQSDGIDFLASYLKLDHNFISDSSPDWIIPALPVHLAAEWCMRKIKICRIEIPKEIDNLLPNPMRGKTGDIYVSHANFICPDNCAEPADICTVTRMPRKKNMFEVLAELDLPPLPPKGGNYPPPPKGGNEGSFKSLVIRSRQLGPGVGGYRPEHLFDLLKKIEQEKIEQDGKYILVSTACRCHGVITGVN